MPTFTGWKELIGKYACYVNGTVFDHFFPRVPADSFFKVNLDEMKKRFPSAGGHCEISGLDQKKSK